MSTPYEKPTIRPLGSIQDLTLAGNLGGDADGVQYSFFFNNQNNILNGTSGPPLPNPPYTQL
jgi:hypothetical protein